MRPLTRSDFPTGLMNRIEVEHRKKVMSRILLETRLNIVSVRYATSQDAANLTIYNYETDFVEYSRAAQLILGSQTTFLGLLLRISRELDVLPNEVRLWIMKRRLKKTCFRPTILVAISDLVLPLRKTVEQEMIYVEIMDPSQAPGDGPSSADEFRQLDAKEKRWRDEVASYMKPCCESEEVLSEMAASVGVGMSKAALDMLETDARNSLTRSLDDLTKEYLSILENNPQHVAGSGSARLPHGGMSVDDATVSHAADGNGDAPDGQTPLDEPRHIMIIVKMFDPFRSLPVRSKDRQSMIVDEELEPPCPLVFCGSRVLKQTDSMRSVWAVIKEVVSSSLSQGDPALNDAWSSFEAFQVTNPRTIKPVPNDEETLEMSLVEFRVLSGDIFCIQPIGLETSVKELIASDPTAFQFSRAGLPLTLEEPIRFFPPPPCYSSVKLWLQYQFDRMIITLLPATSRDAEIVAHSRTLEPAVARSDGLSPASVPVNAGTLMETSLNATGKEFVEAIAAKLHISDYRFISVMLCEQVQDSKVEPPLSHRDLDATLQSILKDHAISHWARIVVYQMVPFTDVVYDDDNDNTSSPLRTDPMESQLSNGEGIRIYSARTKDELPTIKNSFPGKFKRFVDIVLRDSKMKQLRRQFIASAFGMTTPAPGSDPVPASGSELVSFESSKRPKLQLDSESKDGDNSLQFRLPVQCLHVHPGFISEDFVPVKAICRRHHSRISDLVQIFWLNAFPGFEHDFKSSSCLFEVLNGRSPPLEAASEPLTPNEIFSLLDAHCQSDWRSLYGWKSLADYRITERSSKDFTLSGKPIIIDYFSEEVPSLFELVHHRHLDSDLVESLCDSRKPLVVLFVGKKKMKIILQSFYEIPEDGGPYLPRSW
jgi:hypothetical protein